jgi:hypothetical protein
LLLAPGMCTTRGRGDGDKVGLDAASRPIVLVVEDNSLVRIVIADFLESAGFAVIQAVDGAAALVIGLGH